MSQDIKKDYAIATFCFSERYHTQANRLIESFKTIEDRPTIVVVTESPEAILKEDYVVVSDIRTHNPDYATFADTYFDFDFSVKRYALQAAFHLGFTKVILVDADAVPNQILFTHENVLKGFKPNTICGQVTYNFEKEQHTNSMLGKRLEHYASKFSIKIDPSTLQYMPEDCIQFIEMSKPKFFSFLAMWDWAIKEKKEQNLPNIPAGNIDEMCFAALATEVEVGNNSDKVINVLTPIHDKWYYQAPEFTPRNKSTKFVTSIYDLHYTSDRGSGLYKGIHLLTQTIRNIIFEEYEYVIYTDKKTYDTHNLQQMFPYANVTFKFKELNGKDYVDIIQPMRLKKIAEGQIWDRIHSVDNYVEVIYNKFDNLLTESENYDGNVMWIDAGLFGTSCANGWRDYMNEVCHTKSFLDKIQEKVNSHGFIALKGNHILINYELKDKLQALFKEYPVIIPGCLFGGDSRLVVEYLKHYRSIIMQIQVAYQDYVSEQEILFYLLNGRSVKFFEIGDWDDLQKGMLEIMDMYDENTYSLQGPTGTTVTLTPTLDQKVTIANLTTQLADCYTKINQIRAQLPQATFTELADALGIDKGSLHEHHMYTPVYEEYLQPYLNTNPVIVEIGINDARFPGGCLKFWDLIFSKMQYYGFDITNCEHLPYNSDKIKVVQGDQNNPQDLNRLVVDNNLTGNIDIVIDDGSHISEHIITTFKHLYPNLKKGGIYFIEDLHAGQAEREKTLKIILSLVGKDEGYLPSVDMKNDKLLIIRK